MFFAVIILERFTQINHTGLHGGVYLEVFIVASEWNRIKIHTFVNTTGRDPRFKTQTVLQASVYRLLFPLWLIKVD